MALITDLLSKYHHCPLKTSGEWVERQLPISAVMEIIRELESSNQCIQFAEWLSANEWEKRTKGHPNRIGQYYSHQTGEYKKIEALFDMFLGIL